jgi:hypothetical protein
LVATGAGARRADDDVVLVPLGAEPLPPVAVDGCVEAAAGAPEVAVVAALLVVAPLAGVSPATTDELPFADDPLQPAVPATTVSASVAMRSRGGCWGIPGVYGHGAVDDRHGGRLGR